MSTPNCSSPWQFGHWMYGGRMKARGSKTKSFIGLPRLPGQLCQLLAHALVARVFGEDALEVLARHPLLGLGEVVLGSLGQRVVTDRRGAGARSKRFLQRLVS